MDWILFVISFHFIIALLYFHHDVNKMSFLRSSVKKQALIIKERGNDKQDSQKGKNKGINILCVFKAF